MEQLPSSLGLAFIWSVSRRSSRSDTARALALTTRRPLRSSMEALHASQAALTTSVPFCLSSVCHPQTVRLHVKFNCKQIVCVLLQMLALQYDATPAWEGN